MKELQILGCPKFAVSCGNEIIGCIFRAAVLARDEEITYSTENFRIVQIFSSIDHQHFLSAVYICKIVIV
jgi:hypothetical protein